MSDEDITTQFQPKPTSKLFKDIEGQTFGRLNVLGYAGKRGHHSQWICKCVCGKITKVFSFSLISGETQSCNCLRDERQKVAKQISRKFSKPFLVERDAFTHARRRCQDKTNKDYKDYGGRGIQFRFTSFKEFLEYIGERPSKKHTLDRMNNSGHYEKGNVHWVEMKEQGRNKRNNRLIIINNEAKIIAEWCEIFNQPLGRATSRLYKNFWCVNCAFHIPKNGSCLHRSNKPQF